MHENPMPAEAIAALRGFIPCLDPQFAIVDRRALEEVLAYLGRK